MPRSLRIQYPGAFYHVMARGNRRELIFPSDDDGELFLDTLGEACGMTGWRVHAWVLMGNHYHLLLETPKANLVDGMKWLQNTYTRRFNSRHQGWGRLFGDRYKSVIVESDTGPYYETLLDYIHLNPVRARLIKPGQTPPQSVSAYPWSSLARGYLLSPSKRPPWLAVGDGLAAFGLKDTPSGRAAMVARLDERARREKRADCGKPSEDALVNPGEESEQDGRLSHLTRGWYWGTRDFAERMLRRYGKENRQRKSRNYRASALDRDYSRGDAEAIVAEGMKAFGLNESDLEELTGADPRKGAIAYAVKTRTTMSMAWMAEHLGLKSPANASQQIRRFRRKLDAGEVPKSVRRWLKKSGSVA